MRRDTRSAHPTWILCALVLAVAATSAACAEGTQISTGTGATGTTTGGSGGTTTTEGGSAGAAGNTGGAGGGIGGMGGAAGGTINGGAGGGIGGTGGAGGMAGCLPDEKLCFNVCVPIGDPKFGCNDPECKPCADDHALPGCVGGVCEIIKCDADYADCDADASNGCEVNLPTDPENCGACGDACVVPHATPGCEAGACTIGVCDMPWKDCDGQVANGCETDPMVDPSNCGACGAPCLPGEQCEAGVCGVFCPPDKANCDGDALNGCEVDLGTIDNCAFCNDACDLANATPDCQAATCVVVSCDDGFANCDDVAENGCEANLDTSAADCGACNQACPSGPNSTPVCTAGACSLVCAGGFEDCNGDPLDGCEQPTLTDPSNCGGCDAVCLTPNGTPGCTAGVCTITMCNPGFSDCDGSVANGCEINLGNDPAHCGSCANTCPIPANASATCTGGACGFTCDAGFADCDGVAANGCEVNLQADPTHCGSCANACNLANASAACAAGACTIASCNMGFADCDGVAANGCEINLQTDPTHCGACATSCNVPNSVPACSGGACVVGVCNAPFADCDGVAANGCEVNTDSSIPNCGACGQACTIANGSPACAGGQCLVASCAAGFANCNNLASDGCEVSTATDTANCGTCGNACNLANATEACAAGACTIASCDAGFGDCDGSAANGCEINLGTSASNCGTCGNACNLPNAVEACTGGACTVSSCNAGFGDCDGQDANGCEINLGTNVSNCGTCGNACSFPNASEACFNGNCAIASCDAGFGNCDGNAANGCEINLGTNVSNCGTCGNACSLANASEACVAGSCAVASCDAGFGNCDGSAANGCEINLGTSVSNCGTCGNVCDLPSSVEACVGGACAVASCNAGFGNCDGNTANGCEVNLNSNVGNCGTCGNACNLPNSVEACSNGSCAVASCDAGFGNCDGAAANGCEINLGTNVSNCGVCGNACNLANASEACAGGSCAVASCDAGFGDCDGAAANGCEINLNTNVANCGTCGGACDLPNSVEACASGSCAISSCNAGFGNCDGNTANGCEVNLNSSVSNCGTCGNACNFANAAESCSNGTCALGACDAGFGNCDGNSANGCETSVSNNVANCGTCGNVCNLAHASEACTSGTCTVATCDMPYANCNGQNGDGCEINISTSATNCGGCGNVCNLPNAVPACNSGMCAIGACNPGFADCDGNPMNGCEVNIATSAGNCGGCGNVCSPANSTGTCVAGTCQVGSCNAGFANCDGAASNGCEINTNTSVANCGGCGQICAPANAAGACSGGTCTIGSCSSGFANCNSQTADGCEINLQADVQNCGSCGTNCAVSCAGNTSVTQCSAGSCSIQSCQSGYYNVDGLCSGGCECQASNVSQACGTPASLGTVNLGQTVTTTANLVPLGTEAWYTVTFTGNTNTAYHPRVRFTSNPGTAFQFDIRTNCSGGTLGCGVEGGVSNGRTDWETFNGAGSLGYTQPIPPVGNNGTILIHVYRKAGSPLTCQSYTLQVSN